METELRRCLGVVLVTLLAALVLPTRAHPQAAAPHQPVVSVAATTYQARADVGVRVDVRRRVGHAPWRAVTISLPDGLLGHLTAVPFCAEAAAAAGTCPPESRIGTAQLVVASARGRHTLTGSLSLAGPGDGALARMVLSLPTAPVTGRAGRLVLRPAVTLGERDSRLRIGARLPASVGPVAVATRRLTLDVSRDGFLFNPSGCLGRRIQAFVESRAGDTAIASAPYAVRGCGELDFAPRVELTNEDRETRRRDSRPPLTVDLRPRGSDAALRDVTVAFPRHLSPDIDLLQNVCNETSLAAGECPDASRIATARATSPLIPGELTGPVHLVFPRSPEDTGRGLELPTTAISLEGLGGLIRMRLDGRLRLVSGRLVSEFTSMPDVPLSSFALTLREGNFIATRSLCSPRFDRAFVRLAGHDGSVRTLRLAPRFAACERRVAGRSTMERVRTRRPLIRVTIERAPRGAALRRLRLRLPDALSVRHARRGVSVRVGGRDLPRRHWSLSRSRKELRITGGLGTGERQRVRITFRRGAVVAGRRTRREAREGDLRLAFRVSVRDRRGDVKSRRIFGYDEGWIAPRAAG